jgi:hypothetical protein
VNDQLTQTIIGGDAGHGPNAGMAVERAKELMA